MAKRMWVNETTESKMGRTLSDLLSSAADDSCSADDRLTLFSMMDDGDAFAIAETDVTMIDRVASRCGQRELAMLAHLMITAVSGHSNLLRSSSFLTLFMRSGGREYHASLVGRLLARIAQEHVLHISGPDRTKTQELLARAFGQRHPEALASSIAWPVALLEAATSIVSAEYRNLEPSESYRCLAVTRSLGGRAFHETALNWLKNRDSIEDTESLIYVLKSTPMEWRSCGQTAWSIVVDLLAQPDEQLHAVAAVLLKSITASWLERSLLYICCNPNTSIASRLFRWLPYVEDVDASDNIDLKGTQFLLEHLLRTATGEVLEYAVRYVASSHFRLYPALAKALGNRLPEYENLGILRLGVMVISKFSIVASDYYSVIRGYITHSDPQVVEEVAMAMVSVCLSPELAVKEIGTDRIDSFPLLVRNRLMILCFLRGMRDVWIVHALRALIDERQKLRQNRQAKP